MFTCVLQTYPHVQFALQVEVHGVPKETQNLNCLLAHFVFFFPVLRCLDFDKETL